MQICNYFGIDVSEFTPPEDAKIRRALEEALFKLWDGSPEDANRLLRLLNDLLDLRGGLRD